MGLPPPRLETSGSSMAFSAPTSSSTCACDEPRAFVPRPSASAVYITRTRSASVIFSRFSAAMAIVSAAKSASALPRSAFPARMEPSVRYMFSIFSTSASTKMTGMPICSCRASRLSAVSLRLSPRSMMACGSQASSVSRFSVLFLPNICPVVGSVRRLSGRYGACALEGVSGMLTRYSGAMVARIIPATGPLGAMRVRSFGSCTVRPRSSVKDTVSPAAASFFAAQPVSSPSSITAASMRARKRFIKNSSIVILSKE